MTDPQEIGAFGRRQRASWKVDRGLAAVLESWDNDAGLSRSMVLRERIAAREGKSVPMPGELAREVAGALKTRGIDSLYSHQAEAFALARAGRDVVVATPTASGKSLCYNLPVLDSLARDPSARALYLFPTKALSRDQEAALHSFLKDAGLAHGAVTYDGDTPGDARRAARERSGVILTNPDMLHAGILPHHANWARLFANLRYVVIDELHSYRGVFGSHLANVLRRLQRVAKFHGSSPTFIFASATIGNPHEHASRMIGRDVSLIGESGAPAGPRRVMVYNPPVVNAELGIRASYVKSAVRLAADLVRAEVPTLVFGESRNTVELMLKYLRDRLTRDGIDPATLHAYRGGYLPETRRGIEAALRAGEVRCVVATNALELGIDIGSLDAVVCAGYPGTIAGLWQRFGRAGRRQGESLALLVTSSAPLDQYVAQAPSYLTGAPIEQARIDPDNVEILIQHLKCAAFELPFEQGDKFGDVPAEAVGDALAFLARHEVVHPVQSAQGRMSYHWATDAYPASHVSLRSLSWDNFVIIDVEGERAIAEMDWRSTHTMLHEQAIYQHEGEQYQVERLDFENHKAFVRKVKPEYYTTAMTYTRVSVIEQEEAAKLATPTTGIDVEIGRGDVSVVEKVVGYKKITFHKHENAGYGDVRLPEMQMHTTALWFVFPEALVRRVPYERSVVVDALRGFASALHVVGTIGLMIDPRDLGRTLGDRSDPEGPPHKDAASGPGFDPTIFLYDSIPGGVGLAPRLFVTREELLLRGARLVRGCVCEDGCPACIGPSAGIDPTGLTPKRKRVLLELLDAVGLVEQ